jgi:hypothetical protein
MILTAVLTATLTAGGSTTAHAAYRAYTASLEHRAMSLHKSSSIPAFARKYGLRCSACHTAWPELNPFGQAFRDNGYQLGNDRDSPIFKDYSYFPISARITPQWHDESTTNQPVDRIAGDSASGLVDRRVTQHGFDLSGMDLWTAGTLYKNVSFVLLVSSDALANWHFESAFIRFDNLAGTPWFNIKFGRFETDNLISEKRFLFLSANGGIYQSYHFVPVGDANTFGLGDNQLGVEVSGHNVGSYTRYSLALYSGNEGNENLNAVGSTYDGMGAFSQAFQLKGIGVERTGAFVYLGQRATIASTTNGAENAGSGTGVKPFYRVGLAGDWYAGPIEFLPFYMYASDNAYLATSTAANATLPTGARSATWNSAFLESHQYVNSRFVVLERAEIIRMSQQALSTTPSTIGDIDAYSFGARWSPFMFSRAGVAMHAEYSLTRTVGDVPLSGDGVLLTPLNPTAGVWSSSLMFAFDFAF